MTPSVYMNWPVCKRLYYSILAEGETIHICSIKDGIYEAETCNTRDGLIYLSLYYLIPQKYKK